MKMELRIACPLLALMDGTFSGGEDETTTDLYSDRYFDRTCIPVRIRGRESATAFKN
jgi:hypothetical protein